MESEEATEEAILNSVLMANTTVGRDGNNAHAIPLERLVKVMEEYGHHLEPEKQA